MSLRSWLMSKIMDSLTQQLIVFFAALLLLLSFAMLMQRRMMSMIRLFALQGLVLSINMGIIAYATNHSDLYITAVLALCLKVALIPFILHKLLIRLNIQTKIEAMVNLPTYMLIGLGLVIFAFNLTIPISQYSQPVTPVMLPLSLASFLICFFMMIIKRKAISQVISFLALENSLFFVAGSFAYSMPLIVELGIAFDALAAIFIFGIFFFRIRENFESFDLYHLEKIRED